MTPKELAHKYAISFEYYDEEENHIRFTIDIKYFVEVCCQFMVHKLPFEVTSICDDYFELKINL